MAASDAKHEVCSLQSNVLAQCIDERSNSEYSQCADGFVHFKDSSDHILGETRSSFYLNLVSKPWMSASGGEASCFLPRDLFIKSELVNRVLEDHVKYTAVELKNTTFIGTLRIRDSVSVDGMISEMKKWSSASGESVEASLSKEFTTSVAHMSEVYSFLFDKMSQNEDERRKTNKDFHRNALIFVPHCYPGSVAKQSQIVHRSPGSFYLKKAVCWRDPTGVWLRSC